MNMYEWAETILFFVVLLALVKPFGSFMAKVYQGEATFLSPVLVPFENLLYRICGVNKDEEMDWKRYAWACSSSTWSLCGVTLFAMLMLQRILPLNPQKFPALYLASGAQHRHQLRHQHQLAGLQWRIGRQLLHPDVRLAVHNFVSAATGMAIAIAPHSRFRAAQGLCPRQFLGRHDPQHPLHPSAAVADLRRILSSLRGLYRTSAPTRPWRSSSRRPMISPNWTTKGTRLRMPRATRSPRARRPRRSPSPWGRSHPRRSIKELGTNGGGFFNANSAHPFENPTPLSNYRRSS